MTDFSPYAYMVFLDGRHIKNCLAVDLKKGTVKYYELDREGNIQMEGSRAKIITAKGKIEVKSIVELIREQSGIND